MAKDRAARVQDALAILLNLGMPKAQRNERSALCLLALLNLTPRTPWSRAESPLMGITPIMDWIRTYYKKNYAPNTRETVRRQTMHQFVQAGIVRYNPTSRTGRRIAQTPYTRSSRTASMCSEPLAALHMTRDLRITLPNGKRLRPNTRCTGKWRWFRFISFTGK